jgi:hypothetical protein
MPAMVSYSTWMYFAYPYSTLNNGYGSSMSVHLTRNLRKFAACFQLVTRTSKAHIPFEKQIAKEAENRYLMTLIRYGY